MDERTCANCGAPMSPDQDWCLQCGAGAPGSLSSGGWRSAGVILIAAAVLALAAAGAAVAALSKHAKPHVNTVAVVHVPAASTPVTPAPTTPATPVPTTPALSTPAVKTPKIPVTPTIPKTAVKTTTTPTTSTSTTTTTTESPEETPETQSALLLDTNAASTYNPYGYPASGYGDPSLTIDGDPSTAWTAQVQPDKAPAMAVGVLVNLGKSRKLSAVELISSTVGMRVQFYGTTAHTAPNSITDPAWVPLSHSVLTTTKKTHLKVLNSSEAFAQIVLWISRAPASAVGTEQAPGHVDVNEIEIFPAG